jgi:hypothetical protein
MKTLKFYAVATLVALAMVFVSCSKDELDTPFYTADNGVSKTLNNFEKNGLVSLLEKEKMHRDVYTWMNTQFPSEVFTQLAERDGHYMEVLSIKVDKYGIANPTVGKLPGEFVDASVQNQYNDFIRITTGDLVAMINKAQAMEEALIAEVQEQQSTLSGNTDIGQVYDGLLQESISQLNSLKNDTKGLIHIYAPTNPIKDM